MLFQDKIYTSHANLKCEKTNLLLIVAVVYFDSLADILHLARHLVEVDHISADDPNSGGRAEVDVVAVCLLLIKLEYIPGDKLPKLLQSDDLGRAFVVFVVHNMHDLRGVLLVQTHLDTLVVRQQLLRGKARVPEHH